MKTPFTSVGNYIKIHPKTDIVVLILGLAIFATITFLNVSRASIWFDEAFSTYITQFNFWDIARYTAADVHPPLYYWVLKVWSSLFGTTELAFRSLSILFGAGAATVAFFLSRRLFGRKVAWLSLVFIILSPMLIRYSDEARMYTMTALIVLSATLLMVKAEEGGRKSLWLWYGVLVSLGMWTHYFTALAWLAHWLWRGIVKWRKNNTAKEFFKRYFTRAWVATYVVAVGLFLPWLPFMAKQLSVVQGGGFWIGPVGVDTPTNYLTNYFYYLEHGQVQSWLALIILAVIVIIIILIPKTYRALSPKERQSFWLVTCLAWLPPTLLFLASLPPLRSSFVERYVVPSLVALSIFLAVVLIVGVRKWKPFWQPIPSILVIGMMIFGITNVYYYGNFNKNTNIHILTREVIEAAKNASPVGTPIVAESPWIFYEAAAYNSDDYPVYFIDENTQYYFGSLMMLQENDQHKIKDLAAFEKEHPTIWYIGSSENEDIAPYGSDWEKVQTVGVKDDITGKTVYKATEYKVSAE